MVKLEYGVQNANYKKIIQWSQILMASVSVNMIPITICQITPTTSIQTAIWAAIAQWITQATITSLTITKICRTITTWLHLTTLIHLIRTHRIRIFQPFSSINMPTNRRPVNNSSSSPPIAVRIGAHLCDTCGQVRLLVKLIISEICQTFRSTWEDGDFTE